MAAVVDTPPAMPRLRLGERPSVLVIGEEDRWRRLLAQLQASKEATANSLLLPTSVAKEQGQLVLRYPDERPGTRSALSASTAHSQQGPDPSLLVPQALALARATLNAAAALATAVSVPSLPLSPLSLRFTPDCDTPWRYLLVPTLGDVALGEFARADVDVWAFCSGRALLANGRSDPGFVVAAVLADALGGSTVALPRRERFLRQLRSDLDVPTDAQLALALPQSLHGEASAVVRFIALGFAGGFAAFDDVDRALRDLEQAFSLARVAVRHEAEGQRATARKLLELSLSTTPHRAVPWSTLARLREQDGDGGGTLTAWINEALNDPVDGSRGLLRFLRRVAPHCDAELVRIGLEKFSMFAPDDLVDEHLVDVAYLEARYVDPHSVDGGAAFVRVSTPRGDPWHEVLRHLLLARLLVDRADYPAVSATCKAGLALLKQLTTATPSQGGEPARYAESYLHLLDGVANFGAIGTLRRPDFLIDAYQRFVLSVDGAQAAGFGDLIGAGVGWLSFVARFAQNIPAPQFATVKTGIDAYLSAKGLAAAAEAATGTPQAPWLDVDVLLPR